MKPWLFCILSLTVLDLEAHLEIVDGTQVEKHCSRFLSIFKYDCKHICISVCCSFLAICNSQKKSEDKRKNVFQRNFRLVILRLIVTDSVKPLLSMVTMLCILGLYFKFERHFSRKWFRIKCYESKYETNEETYIYRSTDSKG